MQKKDQKEANQKPNRKAGFWTDHYLTAPRNRNTDLGPIFFSMQKQNLFAIFSIQKKNNRN
jgi:hypothetical protein